MLSLIIAPFAVQAAGLDDADRAAIIEDIIAETIDASSGSLEEPSYIGSNQCKMCHRIWYLSWKKTGGSESKKP